MIVIKLLLIFLLTFIKSNGQEQFIVRKGTKVQLICKFEILDEFQWNTFSVNDLKSEYKEEYRINGKLIYKFSINNRAFSYSTFYKFKTISKDDKYISILTIDNAKEEHVGNYTCSKLPITIDLAIVDVSVKSEVNLIDKQYIDSHVSPYINNLTCTFDYYGFYNSNLTIKWFENSEVISSDKFSSDEKEKLHTNLEKRLPERTNITCALFDKDDKLLINHTFDI